MRRYERLKPKMNERPGAITSRAFSDKRNDLDGTSICLAGSVTQSVLEIVITPASHNAPQVPTPLGGAMWQQKPL